MACFSAPSPHPIDWTLSGVSIFDASATGRRWLLLSNGISAIDRIREWCSHAFAIDTPGAKLSAEDQGLALKVAQFVVSRQMSTPALILLEASTPLNFIGSQFLAFLAPFSTLIFSEHEYRRFVLFLEKRQSIQLMIDKIVEMEDQRNE
jgi:hypothetical protein